MKRNLLGILRLGAMAALATVSAAVSAQTNYPYPATVISQSPPVYYLLNETNTPVPYYATNMGSFGDSADGTYEGAPVLNLPGPFSGSVAGYFDGTTESYLDAPYVGGINTSNFTFEIWVNSAFATGAGNGGLGVIASYEYADSPRSGWLISQDTEDSYGEAVFPAWVVRMYNQNGTTPLLQLNSPATAGWVDLAFSYNAATGVATLYTNGVVANTTTALGYVPDASGPLTIGERSDGGFPWTGYAAETALYGTCLPASRIAAHYNTAMSAPGNYPTSVQTDLPYLYYESFASPPAPIAFNYGTLGSSGNGLYVPDTVAAGTAGPTPPSELGFSTPNLAPTFDGTGGFIQTPTLNFNTNTVTFSAWVNAAGTEPEGAGIVVCDGGTTASGLIFDTTFNGTGIGFYWDNNPNSLSFSPSGNGLPQLNPGEWDYVAVTVGATNVVFCVASPTLGFNTLSISAQELLDGTLGNSDTMPNQPFDYPFQIGDDVAQPGGPYPFSGSLDSVGIWNRTLTVGQLYTEYGAAVGSLAPEIFVNPAAPATPPYAGDPLSISVDAGGTPALSYQWYLNSAPIAGATNATYTKSAFNLATDQGSYYVTVTNLYGAATSSAVSITGQADVRPIISYVSATNATVYPHGGLNFAVAAAGGGIRYQWKLNGSPIPGATSGSYVVTNVLAANGGSYTLAVTNGNGATNLGPFVITVPTLATNTYAQVVDADAPESWWRLNDANAANGAVLTDVMNRHFGTYSNVGSITVGNPGPVYSGQSLAGASVSFDGDGSAAVVPYFPDLSAQTFSLEMWVYQTNANEVNEPVVVASDSEQDVYGVANLFFEGSYGGWSGLVDEDGGGLYSFGWQAAYGYTIENPAFDPTAYPGVWTYIVIENAPDIEDGTDYPWTIYVNAQTDEYIWGPATTLENDGVLTIGGANASQDLDAFNGSIAEVAFYNKALSASNITAHYSISKYGQPPYFTSEPQNQIATLGQSVTFSGSASGYSSATSPITYQWKKNGSAIAGQTNEDLTVTNVFYTGDSDSYTLEAINQFGSTNSSPAHYTVYFPATYANVTNGLVLHLPFDGNYNDTSGQGNNGTPMGSPTFVSGIIGSGAVDLSTDTNDVPEVTNYVALGTPLDLEFSSNVNFTVSYWVQMPAGSAPPDVPFLCSAVGSTYGFGLTIAPAYETGGWAWSLVDTNGNGAGVQGPANTINDGLWHNVIESFTRTNNCNTYLDGVLVDSTSIAGIGDVDPNLGFNIGQDPTGTYGGAVTNLTTYNLDDLAVWTNALSYSQAISVYGAGARSHESFNVFGPVAINIYDLGSTNVGVAWQAGSLYKSGKVNGPWTKVTNAVAPFYQVAPTGTNVFYGVGQ